MVSGRLPSRTERRGSAEPREVYSDFDHRFAREKAIFRA